MNFKGRNTYNTWLGVFCTLMVYVIVFSGFIVLGSDFIAGSRQNEKVNTEKYDRFNSKAMYLDEMGVKIYIFPSIYSYEEGENEDDAFVYYEPLRPE